MLDVFFFQAVGLAAIVSLVPAALAQQFPAAPQSAKEPVSVAPLLNARRMALKGIVRSPQTSAVGPLAGQTSTETCGFELMLRKGQQAIEVRMVGQVRKNSATECEADFDVGQPTQIFATPQSVGVSVQSVMSDPGAFASDIVIGKSNGTAPNAALFNRMGTTASTPSVTGQQQFSSGQMAGIVKDPVGLQMTYISQYVGWLWTQTGTCVQASGFSKYITEFWQDGWFLAGDAPTAQYADCNGTVMYDYATFMNYPFCVAYYYPGPYYPPTMVQYWPQQVQGWQDGVLFGNFQLRSIVRYYVYLPAAVAALTDMATAWMVVTNQPDYPIRAVMLQLLMFLAALLIAIPNKAIRVLAILVLVIGMAFAIASIGLFYIPTIFAAGWVLVRSQTQPPTVQSD